MIERDKGKMFVVCDSCGMEMQDDKGKVLKYDSDDFDILVDDMHEHSWKATKNDKTKEWEHYCEDCQ